MAQLEPHADHTTLQLGLDFANTFVWRNGPQPEERLLDYPAFVGWAHEKGLLTKQRAARLLQLARSEPELTAQRFTAALALREAIYAIFSRQSAGLPAPAFALETLNRALAAAAARATIRPGGQGFVWAWRVSEPALDEPLWPIARAAGELLTSPEWLGRVGECADDRGCSYLFLDLSRNHSRRWCDINDCGNRAKQRRYYRRSKQTVGGHEIEEQDR